MKFVSLLIFGVASLLMSIASASPNVEPAPPAPTPSVTYQCDIYATPDVPNARMIPGSQSTIDIVVTGPTADPAAQGGGRGEINIPGLTKGVILFHWRWGLDTNALVMLLSWKDAQNRDVLTAAVIDQRHPYIQENVGEPTISVNCHVK